MITIEDGTDLIHLGIAAEIATSLDDLVSVEVHRPVPRFHINDLFETGRWVLYERLCEAVNLTELTDGALASILNSLQDNWDNLEGCWDDIDAHDGGASSNKVIGNIIAVKRELNKRIDGYVYLLKSSTGYWKIGKAQDPDDRLKTFGVKLPFEVEYEHLIPCRGYSLAEKMLHNNFAEKRINGEWFNLSASDVQIIKSITFISDGETIYTKTQICGIYGRKLSEFLP